MRSKLTVFLAVLALLPAFLAAAVPEGRPAPRVSMKLLRNGAVADFPGWQAYKGKVVVLEFWATWCVPCVANIPHLSDLAKAFRGKPVEFISVTVENADTVKKFLKTHPMAGSVAVDGNNAWRAFGVTGVPQTVIISRAGAVLRYTSPEQLSEKALQQLVDLGSAEAIEKINNSKAAAPEKAPENSALIEVRVASVTENGDMSYGHGSRNGTVYLEYTRLDLRAMLAQAYGVGEQRVEISSALPAQRFSFLVRAPKAAENMLKPLLRQAVLAAYGAQVRRVSGERQVLLAQYDNAPHAGFSPAGDLGGWSEGRDYVRSAGARMDKLLEFLESRFGQPVQDETGLTGIYDMKLEWTGVNNDSVAAALKAQFGITLVPAARTIELLEAGPAGDTDSPGL
ncbi:MAG: TIGR03435 family protein [Elusimicrobiota bacterium]